MGKQKNSQAEFKRFERLFNQVYREKAEKRQGAIGTMTPEVMRKHLASGAPMSLLYGGTWQGDKIVPFTRDDLIRFGKAAKASKKQFGSSKRGVTARQLIGASLSIDIMRAKSQIRSAILYRMFNGKDGMILRFRVTASPESEFQYHQVKIRLDEWSDSITTTKSYRKIAKKVLEGRISIECDCGRHQYWFRYIATIGGFAIHPLEHSYPKIRNPKLTGSCCKHVLKVFAAMRGAQVYNKVLKEIEVQAKAIGYGDDKTGRFLKKDEIDKLEKESKQVKAVEKSLASKAFGLFRRAERGIKQKMAETNVAKALSKLRNQSTAYKQIAKTERKVREKAEKQNQKMSKDLVKSKLHAALLQAEYKDKIPIKKAISKFAKTNDLSVKDVEAMAKDINI
jgi:hypothetical protein